MDLEQLEAFALGDDREAALAKLVPGTEDHDYHKALLLQQHGKFDEVDALLDEWARRHGRTSYRERIVRRQLLHRLGTLDKHAIDKVVDELGVDLDHQAHLDSERSRNPSRLDESTIEVRGLVERARKRDGDLRRITDEGLVLLLDAELDATRRRNLLERLTWIRDARVVDLIAADLGDKHTRGFGSLAIHGRLTTQQLELLVRKVPDLRKNAAWVDAMLVRLRPPSHVDWHGDRAARASYLDAIVGFVATLPPTFNSLRAHVLWHRLDNDRYVGRYDRERFVEYLKLPRGASYVRSKWIEDVDRAHVAQVGRDHAAATGLPPVADEEGLVRDYLHRLLATEDGKAFADWLDSSWLERELATARLLAGDRDVERWTTKLGAAQAAALRDRVDLDLVLDNPTRLAASASLALGIDIKNVPSLTVKVFRIDELAYFLAHGREVTTAIDLDGLTGGFEQVIALDHPPLHRVRRRIDLPAAAKPGTYVVELIGNGKSSRALIRKGRLRHAIRYGAAGAVITVADEAGAPIADATAWMGGREYRADGGAITIPFSTRPGRVPVLFVGGGVAQREEVYLPGESYALDAGLAIERESLAAGGTARAILRTRLTVADATLSALAPIALLEEARVEIATTDGQGATSAREQPLVLADDRDSVLEWAMPPDVAQLRVTVRGKVRSVSEQKDIQLADGVAIDVAQIHRTSGTEAVFLARTDLGWVVSVLGKTGEPLPRRQVNVTLHHRFVSDEITATLDTDDRGRIELGRLDGITHVTAATSETSQSWPLVHHAVHARRIHAIEGTPASIALPAHVAGPTALARASLIELRGGAPARDATSDLRAEPAAVIVDGARAGDYALSIAGVGDVHVHIVPAGTPVVAGWAATTTSMIELSPRRARIGTVAMQADHLRVEVIDAGPTTRVHVVATRLAAHEAGRGLAAAPRNAFFRNDPAVDCQFVSGRDLGDEYRYVLERRTSKRRPGLLLDRPGLLLNPWAVRATSTGIAHAAGGTDYKTVTARTMAAPMQQAGYGGGGGGSDNTAYPSHDWVPRPVAVIANLEPDASGVVVVDRAALAGMGALTIHCVEAGAATMRDLALPEVVEPPKDLRLRPGLDPERHVIERKDVIGLAAGKSLVVDDMATARVEIVDTVGKAYRYLLSLHDDATLRDFGFIARWHELTATDKRAKYSKYACHELHLFLAWKDPVFFAEVVKPYLANKQPRTFVDRWLLDDDVARDRELWRLGRLNVVERCLLLRRVPVDVADAIRRLIGDQVDLVAPDPERDAHLVDALLGASALSTDQGEIASALRESRDRAVAADKSLDVLEDADYDEEERGEVTRGAFTGETKKKASRRERGGPGGRVMAAAPAMAMAPPAARPMAKADMPAAEVADDGPVAGDMRRRAEAAPMYRGADLTQEWAENNWWHYRPGSPEIAANRYWRDFAAHDPAAGEPFLSPHLGLCAGDAGGFHAAMCALAVLDLPFAAAKHDVTTAEGRMTIRVGSNALIARRQLAEVAPASEAAPVLIGQNLVRADDRHEWDGAEQREKYVAGELLSGVVYTELVAVTNPTSTPVRVDVLVQIPRGALAIAGNTPTRTIHMYLDAYGTGTHEQSFYFPAPGRFGHYPAHVARKGELLAWAPPSTWDVAREPTTIDPTSWRHLSQRGNLDQVAGFLAAANLGRIELPMIGWRMKDRTWFDRVIGILSSRGWFDGELWGYALHHRDAARIREWLDHQDDWLRGAGRLDNGPVSVDEEDRGWHEHLEYAPLINARAHRLGARARILNDGLAQQYRDALDWIAQRTCGDRDRARAAHYLFSQDRLDEALALLERVDPARAGAALQTAYLRAYGACARGDLGAARALAAAYAEHPVDRWRHRFAALIAMLDEAEGRGGPAAALDPDSRDQRMAELAARQPAFELAVDPTGVNVDHRNLAALELRFHKMDLELLFSRQPFMQSDTARFSFVDPGRTERLELAGDGRRHIAWPDGLARTSVVVEAVAAGVRKAIAHYAHDLLVTVAHQYGQVRVARASSQAIMPATYVKVYGRQRGGAVAFFKDGYTDLRGRFDYATLSTDDLDRVERFAILVASDDAGALVVEAAPPAR